MAQATIEATMSVTQNPPLQRTPDRPVAPQAVTMAAPKSAKREQFIPLRKSELVDTLAGSPDLNPADADAFRNLCRRVQALVHSQCHEILEELKDAYAPFDPDSDTRSLVELNESQLAGKRQALFLKFAWLLERGNFVRAGQAEIDEALSDCSQWGLNLSVDFGVFDRLDIYYRGDVIGTRFRRRLRNRFRSEAVPVPVYQRLVVIFRLKPGKHRSTFLDTQDVYIKLFKDIPKVDLDMLLPGTQVQMSLLDRCKIVLPTLSGVSIAVWKIVQGAILVAAAGFYGSLAFLGLIGGTVGYGVRSFYGYLNTKQKYQLNLTQSLYYQNLDNNAGAIHRLLDEAEEQENREAMLGYYFLWRHAPAGGWTDEELDQRIEAFLRNQADQDIDFEISDSLDKLARMKIIESRPGGRWSAVPIDEALVRLAQQWREQAADRQF